MDSKTFQDKPVTVLPLSEGQAQNREALAAATEGIDRPYEPAAATDSSGPLRRMMNVLAPSASSSEGGEAATRVAPKQPTNHIQMKAGDNNTTWY